MFGKLGKKRKQEKLIFDREQKIPAVRSSICTGEKVAGFQDKATGRFEEITLIKTSADLAEFAERCGVSAEEIKAIY